MPFLIERRSLTSLNDTRVRSLSILALMAFMGLFFRLFELQVFRGAEMFHLAELNRTQVIPLVAPRGTISDRHGEVLLDSAPRFSLFYTRPTGPTSSAQRDLENELVKWFPESETTVRRKLTEARQTGKMTRILSGIPRPMALAMIEKRLTLPGVNVMVEPQRHSRYGTLASHLLGYVDEISPRELSRLQEKGYKIGQLIGRAGVERIFDSYLRGEDGGLQFEMDATGRHVHVMQKILSKPGNHVTLSIDRKIQQVVEDGLRNSPSGRGAAVVMDPRTGAVLALASAPDYDPTGANMMPYLRDPQLPLFNRALQGSYPPGSIFKIMTAAAALQLNWNLQKTYYCPGVFRLGSKEFACWSVHHLQDFKGAMAWSCNFYYYSMGLFIGPDLIEKTAKAFGLGEKSGVDLPSESSGLIPGRAWKKKAQKAGWFDGDTVNFSIGQGAVSVTPMQAAVMVSAVANGGTVWKPYVVEKVVDNEGHSLYQGQSQSRRAVELSPSIWKTLHDSMEGVVQNGSGRGVLRPDLVSGAKTGTAQNPHGKDHAWFAAYSGRPGEAPSLVVIVFVEHGGRGSVAAGPIARQVINTAFPPIPVEQKS